MSLQSEIANLIRESGQSRAQGDLLSARIAAEGQRQQGENSARMWSNIGNLVGSIPGAIAQEKELKLKQQQQGQEQQLLDLRVKGAQADTAEKLRKQQQEQQVADIFKRRGADIDGAIDEVMSVNPEMGMTLHKHQMEAKTQAFQYQETQIKAAQAKSQFMGQLAGSVTDQETYTKALYTAHLAGIDVSQFPQDYESAKPVIAQTKTAALTAEQQTNAMLKAVDDARQDAARQEKERADKATEAQRQEHERKMEQIAQTNASANVLRAQKTGAAAGEKLTRVEHKDENGQTVIEYLPQSALKGQTFKKGDSATVANRAASSEAVNQTGQDIIAQLKDPNVASKVGPAMGRYNSLREFLGNPPPELAELAGSIESYALANMGVHGMRSVQGANEIKKLLDQKHTPESLIKTIEGLNKFSSHFLENAGRPVPTSAPKRGSNPYPPK